MSVVEMVAPEVPAGGLIVDVKRNGAHVARMEQLGEAWALEVYGPEWHVMCTDVVEAYDNYVETCREGGVATDGGDILTVIEVKQCYDRQAGANTVRTGKRIIGQIVNQQDDTWTLNVFYPRPWQRACGTIAQAFHEFRGYLDPRPGRGPADGCR